MWNKNICITSRKTTLLVVVILLSTIVLASVWTTTVTEIKETPPIPEDMWIPTEEDIAYQDSMYQIIQQTQSDIDTIKANIVYILERLDYPDGTYDSIRYVKGGIIDKRRN